MKETLKNIIICVCIVYFILSLGYTIISEGYNKEILSNYQNKSEDQFYQYDISVKSHWESFYTSKISILDANVKVLIISICAGTMIGLIISTKENSIAKYIIFFIFGNIVYSLLWTCIALIINRHLGNYYQFYIEYVNLYKQTAQSVFISYLMIYSVIVGGIIFYNKKQVKELNETLKGKGKEKIIYSNIKKIPIIKIIVSMVILMIVIFIAVTIRKTLIILNYSKKVKELSEIENYYVREERNWRDGDTDIIEKYCKDEVLVRKENDYISYIDKKKKQIVGYNMQNSTKNIKEYNDNEYEYIIESNPNYSFYNYYFGDTDVGIWMSLIKSFEIKVNTKKVDGKKCYAIEYYGNIDYIDVDTYLLMRRIQSGNMQNEGEDIFNYTYEFGNVTDEDIAEIDI